MFASDAIEKQEYSTQLRKKVCIAEFVKKSLSFLCLVSLFFPQIELFFFLFGMNDSHVVLMHLFLLFLKNRKLHQHELSNSTNQKWRTVASN